MSVFGLQAFRKHKEVVPLVAIIAVATIGCIGFSMYTMSKPDVQFSRKDKIPSWMRYSPDKTQKLFTTEENEHWKPDKRTVELEKLRKEIGSTH
uniref:Uncharacterized protein n=1 Tax=Rhipicephalus pulchellus TaxID=72859 RepID=L7LY17_RHIPC